MNRYPFRMIILLGCMIFLGCSRKASNEETATARSPVVEVKAVPVAKGDIEDAIVVEGTTDVVRKEKIVSPIAGVAISVRRIEGAPVRPGDTLAVIRSGESQAAIDGANVLVRAAKSEGHKKEALRSYDLSVSSQNVMAICCTSAGVVASRGVNKGEFVSEGAELFTIIDLSSIYFAADIPLKNLPQVHAGAHCRVSFASVPGVEIAATVGAIEPSANLESQSVKAHLVFEQLRPEERSLMKTDIFGSARIVTGVRRGVLLVPPSAVLRDDETNTASVVVIFPGSVARTLEVTVGATDKGLVEVAGEGLREGQLVITEGNYGLPDSTRVRLSGSERP